MPVAFPPPPRRKVGWRESPSGKRQQTSLLVVVVLTLASSMRSHISTPAEAARSLSGPSASEPGELDGKSTSGCGLLVRGYFRDSRSSVYWTSMACFLSSIKLPIITVLLWVKPYLFLKIRLGLVGGRGGGYRVLHVFV